MTSLVVKAQRQITKSTVSLEIMGLRVRKLRL